MSLEEYMSYGCFHALEVLHWGILRSRLLHFGGIYGAPILGTSTFILPILAGYITLSFQVT